VTSQEGRSLTVKACIHPRREVIQKHLDLE